MKVFLKLPHIIMNESIHNLRKDMRAYDHTLTFVIVSKCTEQNWSKNGLYKVLFQVHRSAECWMKKRYRLLKISVRKGRFISSLFMVYFSVVSKWFDSIFTIFRAINCPKLSPIFLSSRFIKFYWIQNWLKYSENISNWLSGLEIAVYLIMWSFIRKMS